MGAKFGIAFLVLLLAVSKQKRVNGYGLQQEDSEVDQEDEVCARINENSCDPFQGDWVFDDSYPPFNTSVCQFLSLDQHYDCQYNGRPDGDYLKYRWQPTDCDLPRIDTEDFLSRLRGKKLLFVGEHLGFNQYQSLTCTLVASSKRSLLYNAFTSEDNSTFRFPEYDDARVYYTPKPFLVDLISDPAKGRVLKIDSIGGGSGKTAWKDMDVLIFNSWYSWTDSNNKLWDYIEEGNNTITDIDPLVAYEKGLNTWAKWVDANINASKTMVFFQGISPDHTELNDGKSCLEETKPRPFSEAKNLEKVVKGLQVVERVLGRMSTPVYLLNVTSLSNLRTDSHPSNYGNGPLDCIYWCLSGVLDAWNQLLYAFLIQS